MNHKLESRLPGEISLISDVDDSTIIAESKEGLKSLLMKMKEKSRKAGLKLSIQKTKIMASGHHFMANRWGKSGNSGRVYVFRLQNHCIW